MTHTKNTYYFNSKEDNVSAKIAHALSSFINFYYYQSREIVILCIGSDRVTGDSLGPLIGYKLENFNRDNYAAFRRFGYRRLHLYGTLEYPVHAMNLKETVDDINFYHPDCPIIAIDASLGNNKYIGYITVGLGPLHPGTGVNKKLPAVGDIFITGIVGASGMLEQMVLQNTRLSTVMTLADKISQGLTILFSHSPKQFL